MSDVQAKINDLPGLLCICPYCWSKDWVVDPKRPHDSDGPVTCIDCHRRYYLRFQSGWPIGEAMPVAGPG